MNLLQKSNHKEIAYKLFIHLHTYIIYTYLELNDEFIQDAKKDYVSQSDAAVRNICGVKTNELLAIINEIEIKLNSGDKTLNNCINKLKELMELNK